MAIYDPCEPFQAYNRIEARPRQEELDDALAAKVHDPLWMLARQYQFGEFKGEDAGSAIFAKVALNSVRMKGFKNGENPKEDLNYDMPLETKVEAITPKFDHKISYRLGKKFLEILDRKGLEGNPGIPYSIGDYNSSFYAKFPFETAVLNGGLSSSKAAAAARSISLQNASSFVRSLAGRALNGKLLWDFLGSNPNNMNDLVITNNNPTIDEFISDIHLAMAKQAAQEWIDVVKKEFNLPENAETDCWHPEKLEYAFDTFVDEGNNDETQLHAEEYFQGHLDWYSFDVKNSSQSNNKNYDPNIRKREVLSVIPTEASFAGMPNSRWWEMEDGTIDLGNLKASDTDIAKILVSQYALQYSNDWLSIPYDLPTGSFTDVEGIVVTDTFGRKTFIEAAHKNDAEDWNSWNMYSLTVKKDEFEEPDFDKRMLLPPSVARVHESDPLEVVKFIRDEMANLVWGIESRVPDGLGGGMDGYEAAKNLQSLFEDLLEEQEAPNELTLPTIDPNTPELKATTYKPQLKYMLGNTVTENWIPFIATHKLGSNREVIFQRASMPRINDLFDTHAIRPRTQLLRIGIDDDDEQQEPYYLNEEEIPRSGITVKGTYQRTRWYNGKILTWYGRRKNTGRGEGSSGLRFDLVLDNK